MKISIINGSPKGEKSVTLQYIYFIEKKYPDHEYTVHNVGQKIKAIEKNENLFNKIIEDISSSDLVIWCTPVYFLLVPAQLKRFIELIFERNVSGIFKDRYTSAVTTSLHFFDHTAHNYMRAICDDLEMKYIDYLSSDMNDLIKEIGRESVLRFAENLFDAAAGDIYCAKQFQPIAPVTHKYTPGAPPQKIDPGNRKIVIVADSIEKDSNLEKMIERFKTSYSNDIQLYDLSTIKIDGGCKGCIKCSFENKCTYEGQDEYIDFYNNTIKTADGIIFSGTIQDRFLSSGWKMYMDRSFFNTHIPTLLSKQVGFIISGPLQQNPNIRQIFESYIQLNLANCIDFVTDEDSDSAIIDSNLQMLAEKIVRYGDSSYVRPFLFPAHGGRKIFRDDVWGRLRFIFQADHRYYEENNIYDFPQNDTESIEFSNQMIEAMKDPEFKESIRNSMREYMVEPFKNVLDSIE